MNMEDLSGKVQLYTSAMPFQEKCLHPDEENETRKKFGFLQPYSPSRILGRKRRPRQEIFITDEEVKKVLDEIINLVPTEASDDDDSRYLIHKHIYIRQNQIKRNKRYGHYSEKAGTADENFTALILSTPTMILVRLVQLQMNSVPVAALQELRDHLMPRYPTEECVICSEPFVQNEAIRILQCLHRFHCRCVKRWFEENSVSCPMCRCVIETYPENIGLLFDVRVLHSATIESVVVQMQEKKMAGILEILRKTN